MKRTWLIHSIITMFVWGLWGAFSPMSVEAGFPETLGYVVWAGTMILPAIVVLTLVHWQLDTDFRSVALGSLAGFLGAGGQLYLFYILHDAPANLVWPLLSLQPVVTITIAVIMSGERTGRWSWIGIALSLIAGVLLSVNPSLGTTVQSYAWVIPTLIVFFAWGIQANVISHACKTMKAESIFAYMTLTAILLIPVALRMTDFSKPIYWGFKGPYLAVIVQLFNAVGALLMVFAFRSGKAIIVAPMINVGAPVITVILTLIITGGEPKDINQIGMYAAIIATVLMALEGQTASNETKQA